MFNPQPKQGMPPKKARKPLKRSPIRYKYKNTGQISVFENIAAERPWICFVTGVKLTELKATQFAHVLSKALNRFPKYKNYDKNIVLLSDSVHFAWDHTPRSELRKDPRFDKLFELEAELKNQYPEII